MIYGATFLEGVLAFISPCILPMLPVYLAYLSGKDGEEKKALLINSLFFVLGFTVIYVGLGAAASSVGRFLAMWEKWIFRASGGVLVLFGLHYAGVIVLPFLNREVKFHMKADKLSWATAFLFGFAFSFGWSPCTGMFLGSALTKAAKSQTLYQGIFLLFIYSLGLGLPFLATAFAYQKFTGLFGQIKKHYLWINRISGVVLIITGISFIFDFYYLYARIFS